MAIAIGTIAIETGMTGGAATATTGAGGAGIIATTIAMTAAGVGIGTTTGVKRRSRSGQHGQKD